MSSEMESQVEDESREQWTKTSEEIKSDINSSSEVGEPDVTPVDFD